MYACRVEDGKVFREPAQAVVESRWASLVHAKKLGTTVAGSNRYFVVNFETKSGTEKDALMTPAGAWMLDESEARQVGLKDRIAVGEKAHAAIASDTVARVPAWKDPMGTSRGWPGSNYD